MSETNLLREILLALTKSVKNTRLFRNNTGTGWQGKSIRDGNKLTLYDPRPIQAGLCLGSSDLIGWTSITITPDLVGKQIAVFTAIEIKTKTGGVSDEQAKFLSVVKRSGGFAHVAKSPDDAVELLSKPPVEQLVQ